MVKKEELEKEIAKGFIEAIISDKEDKIKEVMKKVMKNAIEEDRDREERVIEIGGRRFIKFREISDKEKRVDIYIDTTKIIGIFDYEGEVVIRIGTPEFFIYKVEGSIEEVLELVKDR